MSLSHSEGKTIKAEMILLVMAVVVADPGSGDCFSGCGRSVENKNGIGRGSDIDGVGDAKWTLFRLFNLHVCL